MTESEHPSLEQRPEPLRYQRCRFVAQLPRDQRYTNDHYWVLEQPAGLWRVGLTPWAVRMLGDFVQYRFDATPGAEVRVNDALGTLEAFTGLVEIRAVATGTFVQANPVLAVNLDAMTQDCYGTGWLYQIRGVPETATRDAARYQLWLDQTIDTLRGAPPPDLT